MKIFTTVILLTALTTPLEAQWLERRTPGIPRTADGKPDLTAPTPRTADGKPDLTGLWQMISPDGAVGNVSLRKPGNLQAADIQPWVQALVQQRAENFGIAKLKAGINRMEWASSLFVAKPFGSATNCAGPAQTWS